MVKTRFDFGPLARTYDSWYETDAGRAHDRVQKADVEELLPRPRSGAELLDVGCGTGHWSRFFAGLGYRVHGVDLSDEMISVAMIDPVPGGSFTVADAARLPFPDARFDIVAAMGVLEFVPDAGAVVREMARCTRSGGSLLIGTLNRLSDLNRRRLAAGTEPYASAELLAPHELKDLLCPYGTVRMRASSPQRRRLQGPFLVADVHR